MSGVTGAAPIWREIVDYREWFVAGTDSSNKLTMIRMPTAEAATRIVAPGDGTVIAPDPDIPAARQSMLVRADAPRATRVCLKLGDRSIAPCGVREVMVGLPAPGRHQIRLETVDGALLAQAAVEVRAVPR